MLRIEIIGNLGSDPEQRFTPDGVPMANIRVAANSRRRGAGGEQVDRTDWFRVRAMGSKAEYVQRFTKGQRVLVIGRLEISEWTTRENEVRTSFDIWADDVVNLSPREDGGRGQGESTSSAPNGRPAQQPAGAGARRGAGDDATDLGGSALLAVDGGCPWVSAGVPVHTRASRPPQSRGGAAPGQRGRRPPQSQSHLWRQ